VPASTLFLSEIVARRLLEIATERLQDEPVLALQGPRTVGKSTVLRALARSCGVEVLDLDDPAVRSAVEADPGAFADGSAPVCIDGYQHVPALLDAIKAELNRDLRPGRFVIAGSTRYDALPLTAQSLTGRLHLLTLWPLTQGEIGGIQENLLDALLSDPTAVPRGETSSTSREDYIGRVVAGGMPIPLSRATTAARSRWFDDYLKLVIERDVRELSTLRRREQLPDLLARFAAQTARVLNVAAAASETGIDRATATDYLKLLEAVFLVLRLPAWGRTLRARRGRSEDPRRRLGRRGPPAAADLGEACAARPAIAVAVRAPARDLRRRRAPAPGVVERRGDGLRALAHP
jgi:hypothetical protein